MQHADAYLLLRNYNKTYNNFVVVLVAVRSNLTGALTILKQKMEVEAVNYTYKYTIYV